MGRTTIGVNTFLSSAPSPKSGRMADAGDKGSPTILSAVRRMIPAYAEAPADRRATEEEKEAQDLSRLSGIATVENPASSAGQALRAAYSDEAAKAIKDLQQAAIRNENMFEVLMEATKYCSLGQLTEAMFEVGGQYRRNM